MKRIHGRQGEQKEFVEFICKKKTEKVSFIAQRSGVLWHTYYSEATELGQVKTIRLNFSSLEDAEAYAKTQAQRFEAGEKVQFD